MSSLKLWTAIGMLVLASSAGDVMLSAAMKRIGDLDAIRINKGLLAVIGHVVREKLFFSDYAASSSAFSVCLPRSPGGRQPRRTRVRVAYLYLLRHPG